MASSVHHARGTFTGPNGCIEAGYIGRQLGGAHGLQHMERRFPVRPGRSTQFLKWQERMKMDKVKWIS